MSRDFLKMLWSQGAPWTEKKLHRLRNADMINLFNDVFAPASRVVVIIVRPRYADAAYCTINGPRAIQNCKHQSISPDSQYE